MTLLCSIDSVFLFTGRSRKHGGLSILLAMDRIKKKEIINRYKVKLMNQAIDVIMEMPLEERRRRIKALVVSMVMMNIVF